MNLDHFLLLGIFGTIGAQELIIVAVIVLVLFGHRLPSVMGSLGKGIRDFKRGIAEEDSDDAEEHLEGKKKNKSEVDQP